MAITKRYRLVIDYEVEVSDFEPSGWHGPKYYPDFGTPGFNEWAENQRRLFESVLTNPNRVEQMCQRSVLNSLEFDLGRVGNKFSVPKTDDLYAETFAEMSDNDKTYWANICHKGSFWDEADFVTYRFQPFVQNCTLQNLETGELIETKSYRLERPFAEPLGEETVSRHVEAFGTWAEPEAARYEPDATKLEDMRKQVSLKEELPESIRKFLQLFAILRTIFTHVNPESPNGSCNDEQIIREANEWVTSNPLLSKQDLSCLKRLFRDLDLSNFLRHNFLQDMRKKNFGDLCREIMRYERVLATKTA